jgi:hypothetical protein
MARHPLISLFNIEQVGALIEEKQKRSIAQLRHAEEILLESVQCAQQAFKKKQHHFQEEQSLVWH